MLLAGVAMTCAATAAASVTGAGPRPPAPGASVRDAGPLGVALPAGPLRAGRASFAAPASGGASLLVRVTQVLPATLAVGGSFRATATVGPAPLGAARPTGNLTIDLYGPADPTCAGAPLFTATGALDAAGTVTSGSYTPPAPGTYRLVATYGGDANYQGGASACADPAGAVLVRRGLLAVAAAAIPATVALGASFDEVAALGSPTPGAPAPTGSVAFALYGPGDPACAGPPVAAATEPLHLGAAVSFTPPASGIYHVVATYLGDANYDPSASHCAGSRVVVKRSLAVVAAVAPAAIALGGSFGATAVPRPGARGRAGARWLGPLQRLTVRASRPARPSPR